MEQQPNQQAAVSTTGSEQSNFLTAVIEAKHAVKIREYPKATALDKVKHNIRYVLTFLGVSPTNWPGEYSLTVIYDYFVNTFNWISPDDIALAFKAAGEKRFEVDISLYNKTFSAQYVADVVKKYIEWRGSIKDVKIVQQIEEKSKITEAEKEAIMSRALTDAIEIYIKLDWYNDLGNSVHNYLVRKGKIKEDSHLRYVDQAKEKIANVTNCIDKDEYNSAKNFIKKLNGGELPLQVEFVAKEICLNEYLKYMTTK
jgi:hypothetical protein